MIKNKRTIFSFLVFLFLIFFVLPISVVQGIIWVGDYVERISFGIPSGLSIDLVDDRLWAFSKSSKDSSVFPQEFLEAFPTEAGKIKQVFSYGLLQFDIHIGYDVSNLVILKHVD